MHMLTITGAKGAGKSTALTALFADRVHAGQACIYVDVARGGVRDAKNDLLGQMEGQPSQVFVDAAERPSPSFAAWLQRTCDRGGVKFLSLACPA